MGLVMRLMTIATPPEEMKGRCDALISKYNGRYYDTAEEMSADAQFIQNEMKEIYKDDLDDFPGYQLAIPSFRYRYNSHDFAVMQGAINSLVKGSLTPEEKEKWMAFSSRMADLSDKIGDAVGKEAPLSFTFKTDDHASPGDCTFYPEEIGVELQKLYQDLAIELDNSLAQLSPQPESPTALPEDERDYRAMDIRFVSNMAKTCLRGVFSEHWPREDEHRMVMAYGMWFPASITYKEGTPGEDLTRAVRFEKLLPVRRVTERASDTELSMEEYLEKARKGAVRPSDEMDIRRKLLTNGGFIAEGIEKMKLNAANERIKASFQEEIKGAYTDLIGDRGRESLSNFLAVQEARRKLIGNGYPMTDVEVLGRTAIFANQLKLHVEKCDRQWAEYNGAQAENERRRKENESLPKDRQLKIKRLIPPHDPLYTEEQKAEVDRIRAAIDRIISSKPGSPENRKALLQELETTIAGMSPAIAKDHKNFTGVKYRLQEAIKYVPNELERQYLADSEPLKELVDSIPDQHYTKEEQGRDIAWLEEKEQKDRELGDIWKTRPWEGAVLSRLDSVSSDTLLTAFNTIPGLKEAAANRQEAINRLTSPDSAESILNHPQIADFLSSEADRLGTGLKNQARIEKLAGRLQEKADSLNGDAKRAFADRIEAVKAFQNEAKFDAPLFNERAKEILQASVTLEKELDHYVKGTEYTLQSRAEIPPEAAVKAFSQLLAMNDSFFHWDSSQFKEVKQNLVKVGSGKGTQADLEKLNRDVKTWLTDPAYDRKNKHTKNEFDNTRFSLMFALANELDPAWAKENFSGMNLTGFHGDKAKEGSFHNIEDFVNCLHGHMADKGFFPEKKKMMDEGLWRTKGYSHGDKGLLDDIVRSNTDPEFSDEVRLEAERKNLGILLEKGDFADKFLVLKQYREALVSAHNDKMGNLWNWEPLLNKEALQDLRQRALTEVRDYVDKPENQKNKNFKQALAAFSVLNPIDAYAKVYQIKNQDGADKEVSKISLQDFEEMGLDLGGRKALKEELLNLRLLRSARRGPG